MRDFLSKGVIQASAKRLELDELPPHDAEGMLPPRVDGEGLFAPYRISLDHFIDRFATGPDRAQLSASLLAFRRSVHEVLMVSPAMWIAGSFVELRAHQPEDIDAVVFFERTGVW